MKEKLAKYGITLDSENAKVEIWGSCKPMREFMYSEDMAAACIYLMENVNINQIDSFTPDTVQEPRKIHFLNIGTGEEVSIKELAAHIKDSLQFKGDPYFNTEKPDGTMRKLTNVNLLHSLGYKHSINLDQGIDLMYDTYLKKQT